MLSEKLNTINFDIKNRNSLSNTIYVIIILKIYFYDREKTQTRLFHQPSDQKYYVFIFSNLNRIICDELTTANF